MTYEDDIGLLADDIRRWAGADARIQEALTQLLKLFQAEVDAIAFEARELDKLVSVSTCQICLQPDAQTVCARCQRQGGLFDDWRSDCDG